VKGTRRNKSFKIVFFSLGFVILISRKDNSLQVTMNRLVKTYTESSPRPNTIPACHLANLTALIGSIYVACAESGDDLFTIYPGLEQKNPFYFFKNQKKIQFFFLLVIFTRKKKVSFKEFVFSPSDFHKDKFVWTFQIKYISLAVKNPP